MSLDPTAKEESVHYRMLSDFKTTYPSSLNSNNQLHYADSSISSFKGPSTIKSNNINNNNNNNTHTMNGNYNSSLQQQPAVSATASQQSYPNQAYTSYYMYNQQPPLQASAAANQQSQPSQQPQQQQYQQSNNAVADQGYGYARYQTGYATAGAAGTGPQNYSLYQQTIPNQLSQPQPQHYNQISSNTGAATGVYGTASSVPPNPSATSNAQSTPIPDTLNPASTSTIGQFQPPDIRPRVTTTMWEDEKTLCYQVDANNVSVVRRADNNMINGTKLLNVAQMTRGRRDGILKSEKVRHVVKIGSMHLKGVWIPFERALAMAQREGIVDLLYPLFVRDIKRVIQTGATPSTASNNPAAAAAVNSNPAAAKASTTPSTNPVPTNVNSYYQQQYGQQYAQQYATQLNGNSTPATAAGTASALAASKSPQQQSAVPSTAASAENYQQLQYQQAIAQQQAYGYQQPYYGATTTAAATVPNQYYPYNYSSYGSQQPVYSAYGYQQLPPQSHPQQIQQQQQQHQVAQQSQQAQAQPQQSQQQTPTHSSTQSQTHVVPTASNDQNVSSAANGSEDSVKKEEK
ncbi:uncharacterized protein RJT21DRAFT_2437 [Scheffersomyces amazonensis]|uniref:uncharacterized protein n=1 Tax=Scheffersomyces amazonensis TaxID=1078765 RepID=UPI00315DA398